MLAVERQSRTASRRPVTAAASAGSASSAAAASEPDGASTPTGFEVNQAEALLTYGRLATDLRLPPDRRRAFLDLCAHFAEDSADLARDITDPAALENARRDAESQFMADLQEIVGPVGVAAYNDYQKELPLLRQVERLAAISPEPLTDAQGSQLEAILKNNSFSPTGELGSNHTQWDKVLAQAKDVLTQAQYDAFQNSHATLQASAALFSKARASLAAKAK